MGIAIESRSITVTEVLEAASKGTLKEIFGCGTAAVISPVNAFGYEGKEYRLPDLEDSYAKRIKEFLLNIQYNKSEDPFGWRVRV